MVQAWKYLHSPRSSLPVFKKIVENQILHRMQIIVSKGPKSLGVVYCECRAVAEGYPSWQALQTLWGVEKRKQKACQLQRSSSRTWNSGILLPLIHLGSVSFSAVISCSSLVIFTLKSPKRKGERRKRTNEKKRAEAKKVSHFFHQWWRGTTPTPRTPARPAWPARGSRWDRSAPAPTFSSCPRGCGQPSHRASYRVHWS